MRKCLCSFFFVLLFTIAVSVSVYSQDYYVSNSGNDNNSGTSEIAPWSTLTKVNEFDFKPGDVIHYKKGDVSR